METIEVINRVNGVNLDALSETVQAMQNDPVLGQSKFRVRNVWVDANHNTNFVSGFYGARQENTHKQTFELHADEPPMLGGGDEAPNPVEYLLSALASCVTTSLVAHAAVHGIEIRSLESEIEGDIDLNGFLGLDPKVPKGFTDIRVKMHVDAPGENIIKLKRLAAFSPVYQTLISNPNVSLEVNAK